jgi:hypothetical protein
MSAGRDPGRWRARCAPTGHAGPRHNRRAPAVPAGRASAVIARPLNKCPRIAYAGLALTASVAIDMIWRGAHEVGSAI